MRSFYIKPNMSELIALRLIIITTLDEFTKVKDGKISMGIKLEDLGLCYMFRHTIKKLDKGSSDGYSKIGTLEQVYLNIWQYEPVFEHLPATIKADFYSCRVFNTSRFWFKGSEQRVIFLKKVLDSIDNYEVEQLKPTAMKKFTNWVSDCLLFQGNTHDITAGALVWAAIGLLIINLTK